MKGRLAWMLGMCAAACGGSSPSAAEGESSESTTGGLVGEPVVPGDICEDAPTVSLGRWEGSLRGFGNESSGTCGAGGPDAFVRLRIPFRADLRVSASAARFEPVVAISASDACISGRELACSTSAAAGVDDLPADAVVTIAVGIEAGDEALGEGDANGDPLAFALDLDLRPIAAVGEACGAVTGVRCEGGSWCAPTSADEPTVPAICTSLVADTCRRPDELVTLTPESPSLEREVLARFSDAHRHGCGEDGRPEYVVPLALGSGWGPEARLEISTSPAAQSVALRTPGCEAGDEVACVADGALDAALTEISSSNALVFVELSDEYLASDLAQEPGELEPIRVSFTVVDG